MQPDALNLAIAQSIEPKPDYRPVITGSISGLQTFTDRPGITDAWMYVFAAGLWRPRNFISDPANSFLLLKRLAEDGDDPILTYRDGWAMLGIHYRSYRHMELGDAIAEYYARAKGIYVDDK